jgi:hypothetical protein
MWQWESLFSRALPPLSLGIMTCAGDKGFFIKRHLFVDQDSPNARASMSAIGKKLLARLRLAVKYLEGLLDERPEEKNEWQTHDTEWSSKMSVLSALIPKRENTLHWIAAPESRSTLAEAFALASTKSDVPLSPIPAPSLWKE